MENQNWDGIEHLVSCPARDRREEHEGSLMLRRAIHDNGLISHMNSALADHQ